MPALRGLYRNRAWIALARFREEAAIGRLASRLTTVQTFYVDDTFRLRRFDFHDIGVEAAAYYIDPVDVDGITSYSLLRIVADTTPNPLFSRLPTCSSRSRISNISRTENLVAEVRFALPVIPGVDAQ